MVEKPKWLVNIPSVQLESRDRDCVYIRGPQSFHDIPMIFLHCSIKIANIFTNVLL